MVYNNILEAMGHTPLIKLNHIVPQNAADVYVKFEGLNVGGSIKTRTAYNMILDAEERGLINPNTIIVEPTSGNQGIGLALVGAVRGYKTIIIMPDSVSEERRKLVNHYGAEVLLIHDAVRPLVTAQTITACIEQLRTFQAVEVAIPTIDTIVQADPSQPFVQAVLDRTQLWNVQTPQGFRRKIIHQAYRLAKADPDFRATDDAGVVLRYCPEVPIGIVEGERTNIKITHPMDLVLAEQILASRK